jgi:hypothetical protein
MLFAILFVQCYADMGEHEVVQLVDCTLRKSDLVKKKNDEVGITIYYCYSSLTLVIQA